VNNLYEGIMESLIRETKKVMEIEFGRMVKAGGFDAENNPLGINDALKILNSLLHIALDERARLDGRLMDSIMKGDVFRSYYADIEQMNQLNAALGSAKKRRDAAKKDYEYSQAENSFAISNDELYEIGADSARDLIEGEIQWGGMFND